MNLQEIVAIFDAKQTSNGSYIAKCPAHDDSTPSLSISSGNNGNVVIHCHAGCPSHVVLSKKGLTMANLWNTPSQTTTPIVEKSIPKKIVETYDYTDETGKLIFQVCRYIPKDFRQRRPDPDKPYSWLWNMQDVERVLYHLPQVLTAIKEGKPIFICEGEKAVLAAESIGLIATCSGGACKWQDNYTKTLTGADIIVIPDNDDPGRKHAKLVVDSLKSVVKSIRVLELPNLPEKGDIYDFIESRDAQEPQAIKDEILKLIPSLPIPQQKTTSISKDNRFKIFYNSSGKGFLAPDNRNGWIPLSETQVKRLLKSKGLVSSTQKGDLISETDSELIMIQTTQNVDYAGPLAGHYAGMLEIENRRILVTESPRLIEPKEGDWNTIKTIITGLFGEEQLPYFIGWVKVAYESLRAGKRTPGQAVAIAGPRDCGKSLIQNLLTPIFGGRCSRPYEYMTAISPFNAHLFGAEHLMVEDEAPATDIRARRHFGSQIKSITVNLEAQCHAKGQTPLMLRPFWRISITLNDEPENLMVLPPMDESIFDKIMLFKANPQTMPMPTATPDQRELFWKTLVSELPAFIFYLTEWKIPNSFISQRFGITHYHHPEIMDAINELAPEHRLLSLIDGYLFDGMDKWTGSSEQLERELTNSESKCYREATKLFTFNTACGVYLSRLARRFPDRFERERSRTCNEWSILAPKNDPST
jgi:hypothetical protein